MQIKSCGIIPFIKFNNSVKFLLIKHKDSRHWSFPKGRVGVGENELETALRELKEETGIIECKILKNFELVDNYTFEKDNKKYTKSVKYFVGETKNSEVKLLKSELSDYRWLGFDEALELITHESTRKLFKGIKKIIF